MKTIEEKAKAYDSIIEKANKMHSENCEACKACIEELIPELAESEDERIRKALLELVHDTTGDELWVDYNVHKEEALAWLEKQGGYANFRNKAQVGDRITKNEDGVLVNLSQLKRVAKPSEKQGEQEKDILEDAILDGYILDDDEDGLIAETIRFKKEKQSEQEPADTVEPKFKVGDWLIFDENHNSVYQVERIDNYRYYLRHYLGGTMSVHFDNELIRLWTLQDAKSGDVLATKAGGIFIYKELLYDKPFAYCGVDKFGVFKDCNCGNGLDWTPYLSNVTPATKEQRDTLEKAITNAGYRWDKEKLKLEKV